MKAVLLILVTHWVCAFSFASDYFILFHVASRNLDYTSISTLIHTIAQNRDFGHAWVYLEGIHKGQRIYLEGGHSGELGHLQPKYLDGIMDQIEAKRPNPIQYLWETQKDGFFQWGHAHHKPSFSLKVELTEEQFKRILLFIQTYPYKEYNLTDRHCCSFVAAVAALLGLELETDRTIKIDQRVYFRGEWFTLWTDPQYSQITVGSPEMLEQSLRKAHPQPQF